ncbi:MAG: hypothetical protein QXJ18_01225 [Desulfurococcaceae archaeon]
METSLDVGKHSVSRCAEELWKRVFSMGHQEQGFSLVINRKISVWNTVLIALHLRGGLAEG